MSKNLVLPNSYVNINAEEMHYIDGGFLKNVVNAVLKPVQSVFNSVLGLPKNGVSGLADNSINQIISALQNSTFQVDVDTISISFEKKV
jgi:hypothetical protein